MIIIEDNQTVKAYVYGDTVEITTANGQQTQTIKVIEGRRYINLQTGEIRNMDTSSTSRLDNLDSTKQTMKKLRRLVAHNFSGGINQLWVTLTYRNHVTDPKTVYKDFKIFMNRLRKKFGQIEYIAVIEPQASGRWHLHVLLKNDGILTIPNIELASLWKQGYTKTKRLKESDKIGNYLVAYLSDLNLESSNAISSPKAIAKGARLYMYPKGLRIYRTSRGIKKPIELTRKKGEIMKTLKINNLPDFSRTTIHKTSYGIKKYTTEFYDNVKLSDIFNEITDNALLY